MGRVILFTRLEPKIGACEGRLTGFRGLSKPSQHPPERVRRPSETPEMGCFAGCCGTRNGVSEDL